MKKILILILVFAACISLMSYLPVHGEEQIYDSVVRLHIIANSDSDADQALKLKVRDAVLVEMPALLEGSESREEALSSIASSLDEIQAVAEKVVRENGYDYPVSAYLGEEEYPTKNYESACFPAGEYSSLQIKIGDADGKNWWCVLFPTLCLSSAKGAEQAFIEVGLSSEQYKIITETDDPKYKLRFKILESIEGMF